MELVITLLVAGVILLLAETVLPGMVAGILGGLCLAAGVIEAYVIYGARTGNWVLLGVVVGLLVGTMIWLKFFPNSRFARLFISEKAVGNIGTERPSLLHQTGTALSHLRPSGVALIGGQRVDVVTEGGLIAKGTPVKVVAIEGMRVVVRALPEEAVSSSPQTQTAN